MSFSDSASPENVDSTNPAEAKPLSEAERLTEQAYQQLQRAGLVPTTPQAIEACNAAITIFRQALEAAADDLEQRREARQGLALTYSQLAHQQRYAGDHSAAVAAFTEALKLNPAQADDYFYRAQSFLKLKNEAAALKDFTEYLRRGEDDYLRLVAKEQSGALALKSQDSTIHAAHWQKEGMRLNSEAENLMKPRGEQAPEPKRAVAIYNRALDAFNKALQANPKDMMSQLGLLTALSSQAECYFEMEEFDLVIDNYSRAYSVRPQSQYLFKRGEAYRAAGHTEQARLDFERYLKEGNDLSLKRQAKKYLDEKIKQAAPENEK
jgi:tetratricopeptide (TPR) repeat protein